VDGKTFARLNQLRADLLAALGMDIDTGDSKDMETIAYGSAHQFIKADKTGILKLPEEEDRERIHGAIKTARSNSRIVIATIHEHDGNYHERKPMEYQADFARQCIEAGADMFICTGPHELWGLEIYKGKLIFHSLGNLFFHRLALISPEAYQKVGLPPDTRDPMLFQSKFSQFFQAESIWESIVPVVTFDSKNNLKEIRLYPVVLEKNVPLYQCGTPYLADKEKAGFILEKYKEMSKIYNTNIVIKEGVGIVVL
jgi:poly-gamma-glutamate synthesis protein (capsule biosynthesis protein)